jgi:Hg(II)-responsive transcriptional regulator
MDTLTIGKLARQIGIGVETLRYYERRGLVVPQHRTQSGYRIYDTQARQRLGFIRRAQALGFSLDEIGELLTLSGQPDASAAEVKQLTQDKIHDIDARILDLQRMRSALAELECQCPGNAGTTAECPILAAFSEGQLEVR